jgi:hypothetical protein
MTPMRLMPPSLILVLVLGLTCAAAPLFAGPCIDLKLSPSFRFEGVLTHKVFPGAPNYADVRKGDKPEPAYVLRLQKSICLTGDEFIDAQKQVDRIQIFPEETDKETKTLWKQLRKLVGKSVIVEGSKPFGAHTGHHHAPLLLPITKITNANRR